MVTHLFPDLLHDAQQYERAVRHWVELWNSIGALPKQLYDWRHPWLNAHTADGSMLMDGNPMFSAVSLPLKRAIRIIQHEPTSDHVEFELWLDTFGGTATDPGAICELVMACALSDVASVRAFEAMDAWIHDGPMELRREQIAAGDEHVHEVRIYPVYLERLVA